MMTSQFPTNTSQALLQAGITLAEGLLSSKSIKEMDMLRQQASQLLSRSTADAGIQQTLHQFNLGVQNSFQSGGVQGLKDLCTVDGYTRMQTKYSGWRQKQICALNLVLCDFLAFNLVEDNLTSAAAFTFEKWVFVYENGEEVHTRGSIDGYDLRCEDGVWKVNSVETFARE
jgi:hypothetical protein